VAKILVAFEEILRLERPDAVGVVGDVNSTCACALATKKAYVLADGHTPLLIHVEAGLRSGDRLMPEEINRVITDAIADVHFTSEPSGTANLLAEGVPSDRVHFVGNVMVDSLLDTLARCNPEQVLERLKLVGSVAPGAYGLVTLHRPSNVDNPDTLSSLMAALGRIAKSVPVLFPVHPRTRAKLEGLGCHALSSEDGNLRLLPPLGYDDFVSLLRNAAFVVTDSGGIQEETTALGVPCLTLRENTERPATVDDGTNVLVGHDTERLVVEVEAILAGRGKRGLVPALWDGRAAERIVAVLVSRFGERS
jgi:UDP-N-acetylglucosamine 2-epimerase (non-hydrolysing)